MGTYLVETNPSMQTIKLRSEPHDVDPRDDLWKVGGVMCKTHESTVFQEIRTQIWRKILNTIIWCGSTRCRKSPAFGLVKISIFYTCVLCALEAVCTTRCSVLRSSTTLPGYSKQYLPNGGDALGNLYIYSD
jgi:hypothetical protein